VTRKRIIVKCICDIIIILLGGGFYDRLDSVKHGTILDHLRGDFRGAGGYNLRITDDMVYDRRWGRGGGCRCGRAHSGTNRLFQKKPLCFLLFRAS